MTEKDIKNQLVREFFSLWQQQIAITARSPDSIPDNLKNMSEMLNKHMKTAGQGFDPSENKPGLSDDKR